MKKCDYCGRENVDDAAQCSGCGTALQDSSVPPPLPQSPARAAAEKRMIWGAISCILGIALTGITYVAAVSKGGGSYVLAWGAIVFGAIQFIRGWTEKDKQPTPEDAGYQMLKCAIALETQGHLEEAVAAYEKIAESFPNSGAGRDAQKSLESLKAKRG